MHPEDDLNLIELIKLLEQEMEEDKKLLEHFQKDAEKLKKQLESPDMPPFLRELSNIFLSQIELMGRNRSNISLTKYFLCHSLKDIDAKISDIYDTLAGIGKHR